MPIVLLNNQFIQNQLICPKGKNRIEYCDHELKGLYIEVRAASSNQGTFYLRYKNNLGKTAHHKIGRTGEMSLAEARVQAHHLKAELAKGQSIKPSTSNQGREALGNPGPLTFGNFFQEYYLPHAKQHKRTWDKDLQYFNLRLNDVFGEQPLDQIVRAQIQSFHNTLRLQGLAPATCNHYVKLMKHAFNLAIDWGYLNSNPAVRVALFHEDNQMENYLNDEELGRLMQVLDSDDNRMICAVLKYLISTGARLNEALQAKWEHVDVDRRLWRIPAQISKSKKLRSVPLNDSALSVIDSLETQGKNDYLFVNRLTGQPYTDIAKVWQRIRIKAGLPKLRIHDLRHQFASFLVNNGRSLYEVQQILGHSTPLVTQRYAHLSTKSLQDAANVASTQLASASAKGMPKSPEVSDSPAPQAA